MKSACLRSSFSRAREEDPAGSGEVGAVGAPSTADTAPGTATTGVVAPAAPSVHAIRILPEPLDATVKRDGKDLGKRPTITLNEGESIVVVVSKRGFEPQTVRVSFADKDDDKLVPLKEAATARAGAAKPPAPAVTAPKPPPPCDPDDPWCEKKKK